MTSGRGIADPIIITAKKIFHGRTLAELSATGQENYHEGFMYGGEMVQGLKFVEYNNVEELKKLAEEMNQTQEDLVKLGR